MFGPIVQSIMDTLIAKKVVVFVFVVGYMVVIFGLTFHLSFGYNTAEYQRWPDGMYVFVSKNRLLIFKDNHVSVAFPADEL